MYHPPQENADDRENMKEITESLLLSEETFVIPLHPRTRKNLSGWGMLEALEKAGNVVLIEPQNFMAFTSLEKYAKR